MTKLSKAKVKLDKAGYLHGYSATEQRRLYEQARFLEPKVFEGIDFSFSNQILELGCGVGAQSEILLERFPHLKVIGVDRSLEQLKAAKKSLHSLVKKKRVRFVCADAQALPFEEKAFDGAFICWFLEHVSEPVKILKELRRTLKPRAPIFCTEVMNSTFFLEPYSPATLQYWFAFNDHQWNLDGDPFVGAKLANLLLEAGFKDITVTNKTFHYDNREPKKRAAMISYFSDLLLSGADSLVLHKRVSSEMVLKMKQELSALKKAKNSVLYYSFGQARAVS